MYWHTTTKKGKVETEYLLALHKKTYNLLVFSYYIKYD